MKVVYIGGRIPHKKSLYTSRNTLMLRYLPPWVNYVETFTLEDAKQQTIDADVIFLENLRSTPFWEQLIFLNDSKAFICDSYCDVWRKPWWFQHIRTDVHITLTKASTIHSFPETEHSRIYWAPFRTPLSTYEMERDIDIIVWGTWHHKAYPFRMYIQEQVMKWIPNVEVIIPNEIPKAGLSLYDIVLNGKTYKLGTVSPRGNYYGTYLYKLLSRCKIACTGPGLKKGSWIGTGKYFENAACSTVTLSTIFDEATDLGFKHGKNIWFTTEANFQTDLINLLEQPNLINELAINSRELMRTRHTPEIRADELYTFLCEQTGKT